MVSWGSYCLAQYVTVKWDVLDPSRLQSIIESDSEYWKNIVVEINFQDGTQISGSSELEVISCWLHKTCSIDSRPCGSRQIAWLIAMCWKRMPALCILAKMDMQTANSRLSGRGSLAHSKQWISGEWWLSWTWHCLVCFPFWQMLSAGCWCSRFKVIKSVVNVCREWPTSLSDQPLSKCQTLKEFVFCSKCIFFLLVQIIIN